MTEFHKAEQLNDLMIVGPITLHSADWIMSRPQIQEEAVIMLADLLAERVQPYGLAIVMKADHFCMHWRGVRDSQAEMTNSVMRGAFLTDANLRREFLALMG